jgi:MFS family permease
VSAGLGAYRTLLSDPRARAFSLAGFVARMPLSMTGLGIVLLVSLTTGSFGRAGLVTACCTAAGAVAAPLWGRTIDRIGHARVLVTAAVINSVSLALLVLSVLLETPLWVTCLTAVGVGLGFSSAGSSVRSRWTHRLMDSPLLNTAYAFEAVIDELVFIVGPVLVTFLATAIHPALGIGTCLVFGLAGALALATMRDTEPPSQQRSRSSRAGTRLSPWVLVPVVAACAALGMLFGGMEVVVVAFAKEAGILSYAGIVLMAWACGSLAAGIVIGTVAWRATPSVRFRVGAVLLALSMLPLPFLAQPLLVAGLLIVSGFAIAPTLIASVAVTQESVPHSRLTEALGWTTMGLAAGVAMGAAGSGQIIDSWGARAGFWGVVGAGALLIIAALFIRGRKPDRSRTVDRRASLRARGPSDTRAADPERPAVETPSS